MAQQHSHLRPDHYPAAPRSDVQDVYFGTTVPDPYRPLEDPEDPAVASWTQAQHDLARAVLDRLPGRDDYHRRLTEVWNRPKMDPPVRRGTRLFYSYNDGLQPQPVLYVEEIRDEIDAEATAAAAAPARPARVLLDPAKLSADGTTALMEWEPDADGRLLAYALSESGEDWRSVRVRDVDRGEEFPETLEHIKFTNLAWYGRGFFYSRFPADATDHGTNNREQIHQLYYHRLGTPQDEDELVYTHPTLRGVILRPEVSDDARYLIITVEGDSFVYNRLYYAALPSFEVRPLFEELEASYEFVGTDGDGILILTSRDAPRGRIVRVHPEQPAEMSTVVPESTDVIEHAVLAGGQLVVTRMHDGYNSVHRFSPTGELLGKIPLPGLGSTPGAGIGARAVDTSIYISYSSFLSPPTILQYHFKDDVCTRLFEPEIPAFPAAEYETRQIFATSRDGTQVPVFVTARRGVELQGDNPTVLLGYGGFDIALKPLYFTWLPVWLERGGVFAVACLRGGSEYGTDWHLDGMFEKKQNVFDDFAAAAEAVKERGYTRTERLAIEGGSNGGLLVAATMLQHPDEVGAVLCHVPVADMLRFQHFTAGRYWTSEYGDADADEAQFRALYAYSPVHNVEDGRDYPPILIMTADHDDRVVPMHSKKLAARLQAADPGRNAVLLRIETKAGHGAGKPTAKQIEQRADVLAFLETAVGNDFRATV
jgi:prolyl oligopeptidase